MEAALSGLEYAYPVDSLSKAILKPPHKWKHFMPPECLDLESKLIHPFAIPVFQLGMCLKPFFADHEGYSSIIDQMIDPDPSRRMIAVQAMTAFGEDQKEREWTEIEPIDI
jgi:hypothetical protein